MAWRGLARGRAVEVGPAAEAGPGQTVSRTAKSVVRRVLLWQACASAGSLLRDSEARRGFAEGQGWLAAAEPLTRANGRSVSRTARPVRVRRRRLRPLRRARPGRLGRPDPPDNPSA